MKAIRLQLFKASKGLNYDKLIEEIIENYNAQIEFEPHVKITSINQTTI